MIAWLQLGSTGRKALHARAVGETLLAWPKPTSNAAGFNLWSVHLCTTHLSCMSVTRCDLLHHICTAIINGPLTACAHVNLLSTTNYVFASHDQSLSLQTGKID